MCRAFKVLCVAPDREALMALKRAAVAANWELAPGAESQDEALAQLLDHRAHVMVVFGDFDGLAGRAREVYPALRIVADRSLPEADEVVSSLEEVRPAIVGLPRPGGPVGA